MTEFLHYPIVRGAASGIIAAAVVDVHAFLMWRKIQEAIAYDWGTAVLGSACFVVGGYVEVTYNKIWLPKNHNSAVFWLALSNTLGGVFFLIAAASGFYEAVGEVIRSRSLLVNRG